MQEAMSNSAAQFFAVLPAEAFEPALVQGVSDFLHQLVVEIQVVHDAQAHGQHLVSHEQVADISLAVAAAAVVSSATAAQAVLVMAAEAAVSFLMGVQERDRILAEETEAF